MQTTTDKMIAALDAFNAGPNDERAVIDLYNITDGFETLRDRARVVPSIFAVIERCARADLGSPGPLVHCIELLGLDHYLSQLVESVSRKPTILNLCMANRILNADIPVALRQQLLDLLKSVAKNPAATRAEVDQAVGFLSHQAGRGLTYG